MNGCLIIGTMDGANIEIAEEAGAENLFIFGFDASELQRLRKERKDYVADKRFIEIMKDIEGGMFGDKDYFKPLVDSISNMSVGNDWFLVANDFAGYLDAQAKVDAAYADQDEWVSWFFCFFFSPFERVSFALSSPAAAAFCCVSRPLRRARAAATTRQL